MSDVLLSETERHFVLNGAAVSGRLVCHQEAGAGGQPAYRVSLDVRLAPQIQELDSSIAVEVATMFASALADPVFRDECAVDVVCPAWDGFGPEACSSPADVLWEQAYKLTHTSTCECGFGDMNLEEVQTLSA